MLYYNIFNNPYYLLFAIISIIIAITIDYIIELVSFKLFAQKYYDLNIHLLPFSFMLLKSKLKKHDF